MRNSIGKGILNALHSSVDKLYDKAKNRFLAKEAEYLHDLSLKGMYDSAAKEEYNRPDPSLYDSLSKIAEGYINSQKENIKAQVTATVDAIVQTVVHKNVREDFQTMLQDKLQDIWKKATDGIETIVATETVRVQNITLLDGIMKVQSAYGIEDPVIYFACPLDTKTCDSCIEFHFTANGQNPRLWKVSELNHGYFKKGDTAASVTGQHPRCRSLITGLMPGYGFNGLSPVWIGEGHDELTKQRNE